MYFGPFASAKAARRTLRLLHKIVPLRDCTDAVLNNRTRPCIKHQIGRCPAPCVDLVTAEKYEALLDEAIRILRGEIGPLVQTLKKRMAGAAEALEFERAQALKEQMQALQLPADEATRQQQCAYYQAQLAYLEQQDAYYKQLLQQQEAQEQQAKTQKATTPRKAQQQRTRSARRWRRHAPPQSPAHQ